MTPWEEEEKAKKEAEAKRLLWLRGLKPGDRAALRVHHFGGSSFKIYEVERFTATQLICKLENSSLVERFDRKTGWKKGPNSSRFTHLEPITPKVADALETLALQSWLMRFCDDNRKVKFSLTTLRALKAAVEPIIAANGGEHA